MRFDTFVRPDEYPLVFDAWATSFKKSPWAGCIPNRLWDEIARTAIAEILDRGAVVTLAVQDLADGTRRVMGYAVTEPGKQVLHWLYVKRTYRGLGIGRALLDEACPVATGKWRYTYRTKASARFLGERFEWDPVPARVKG